MVVRLLHIPEDSLYHSEPPPSMFGNDENEDSPTWTNPNWLKSRFHFSFAEYHDPSNDHFGVLRVMNDDLVQPLRGFGMHPHRDMEIVTYILEGHLTHQDSMNRGMAQKIGRGSVQFMTAGTGVRHSEHNLEESPLRFVQVWVLPAMRGLQPRYGGFDGSDPDAVVARRNNLAHIVGDARGGTAAPVGIHQDCNFYCSELDPGKSSSFCLQPGRQAYLLCAEGSIKVDGAEASPLALDRHDAAECRGDGELILTAGGAGSHLLLVEMAEGSGGRRT